MESRPYEKEERRSKGHHHHHSHRHRSERTYNGSSTRIHADNDPRDAHTDSRDVEDDFPYRRLYMPPYADMFAAIRRVADAPPAEWLEPRDGRALGVVERTFPNDYEASDSLTDHFAEPERVRSREKTSVTPLEAWVAIKRGSRFGKMLPKDPRERRELVYLRSRGCNLFNAALAAHIVAHFGGNGGAVLDCTAGWGDRLCAAHAAGATLYRGWDTNPGLQPVYKSIAEACVAAGAKAVDWSVECAPFESAGERFADGGDLHGKFDVVLVAPPYFDQELYNGEKTSTTVHPTMKAWLDSFYAPMMRQARDACKSGGHVLAYVRPGDLEGEAHKVLDEGMTYLGALGFRQIVEGSRKPAPIRDTYVWRKPEQH